MLTCTRHPPEGNLQHHTEDNVERPKDSNLDTGEYLNIVFITLRHWLCQRQLQPWAKIAQTLQTRRMSRKA